MNKSWKSFDSLLSTPSPVRSCRSLQRGAAVLSSRAIAKLKRSISPRDRRDSTFQSIQTISPTSDITKIEDISSSDEDSEKPVNASAISSDAGSLIIVDCSAPSLDPKDVTICGKSRVESDIEEVSEPEVVNQDTPLEISESSDDSDCEAITCKKNKRLKLDFINRKSPGCGRRITDDIFTIENATRRAATVEQSSTWIKSVVEANSPKGLKKTPIRKLNSNWKRMDESFKDNHSSNSTNAKSPPNRKWKALNETFRDDSRTEIESDLTPENSTTSNVTETVVKPANEPSFYEPSWEPSRSKYRKNCPLSRLDQILHERSALQTFWLHERQMGLVPVAKEPVRIESISKIFGRVAITYYEPDEHNPETQIENIMYVDPSEKQLKTLRKGSRIEVEYDLAPHKLSRQKVVHLGICKIRPID